VASDNVGESLPAPFFSKGDFVFTPFEKGVRHCHFEPRRGEKSLIDGRRRFLAALEMTRNEELN